MTQRYRALLAGAALACVLAVLVLSLAPERWRLVAAIGPAWFNLAHLPAYFMLTAISVTLLGRRAILDVQQLLWIGATIYAFSLIVELVQPLVGRTFSTGDLALNAAGVLAAVSAAGVSRYSMAQRMAGKVTTRSARR